MSVWYGLGSLLRERPEARGDLMARPLGFLYRGWREPKRSKPDAPQWWKGGRLPVHIKGAIGVQVGDRVLVCRVTVDPAPEFKRLTGRGGGTGYVIDAEVFFAPVGRFEAAEWAFHNESRADDLGAAVERAEQIKGWLDRQPLSSLLAVPKAGPLSMSRWPTAS